MGDGLERVTGTALNLEKVNGDDSERIAAAAPIEYDGGSLFQSRLCSGAIHDDLHSTGLNSDFVLQNQEIDHSSVERTFQNTESIFKETDVIFHRPDGVLNAILNNEHGSKGTAINSRTGLRSSIGVFLNTEEPLQSGYGLSKTSESSCEESHASLTTHEDHSADFTSDNTEQDTRHLLPFFNSIPDDILVNIFCRLFDDPRHLARLVCVCTRFCNIIRSICWKSRCEQTLPFLVSEIVHSSFTEPPGGWASLQKLVVCCPGLWHAGVLLEHWDFGLDRELAWFDELNSSSQNVSNTKAYTSSGYKTFGETSSDLHSVNGNSFVQYSSQTSGKLGYGEETDEYSVDVNGCGVLPQNHLKFGHTSRNIVSKDQNGVIHDWSEVPDVGYDGWSVVPECNGNYGSGNAKRRHHGSKRADRNCHDAKQIGRHESGYHVVPSEVMTGEKRKGENCERDERRSKKQHHGCCHPASGSSNLSREQGNKLLANRFRTDCLYISDWPGCVHSGEKRKYKVFRGIFKNFKNSHVWRNLKDMHAKTTNVGCAFCACKTTWDMVTNFCLKRSIEYHDDGEPVVRAYVCENGHVSGAWTDRPMYSL